MKLIKASYEIRTPIDGMFIVRDLEEAGRTCYKSEDKITDESAPKFMDMIVNQYKHNSVIEHQHLSVKFIVDRGVSHELVRHRLASFSQESTRYCNYSKDKFDNGLTFIQPPWVVLDPHADTMSRSEELWLNSIKATEESYLELLKEGWAPQEARSVLPNSLKTEVVMTSNLRHWMEIFTQRTAKTAHPQMREVMIPLLAEIKTKIPIIFDDI